MPLLATNIEDAYLDIFFYFYPTSTPPNNYNNYTGTGGNGIYYNGTNNNNNNGDNNDNVIVCQLASNYSMPATLNSTNATSPLNISSTDFGSLYIIHNTYYNGTYLPQPPLQLIYGNANTTISFGTNIVVTQDAGVIFYLIILILLYMLYIMVQDKLVLVIMIIIMGNQGNQIFTGFQTFIANNISDITTAFQGLTFWPSPSDIGYIQLLSITIVDYNGCNPTVPVHQTSWLPSVSLYPNTINVAGGQNGNGKGNQTNNNSTGGGSITTSNTDYGYLFWISSPPGAVINAASAISSFTTNALQFQTVGFPQLSLAFDAGMYQPTNFNISFVVRANGSVYTINDVSQITTFPNNPYLNNSYYIMSNSTPSDDNIGDFLLHISYLQYHPVPADVGQVDIMSVTIVDYNLTNPSHIIHSATVELFAYFAPFNYGYLNVVWKSATKC